MPTGWIDESIYNFDGFLAVVIAAISTWWIQQTLKEGRKAVDESKADLD